jgi:hypothetical protein
LFTAAIFSLLGQISLVISNINENRSLKLTAIVLLWVGFAYLTHTLWRGDNAAGIGLVFGAPFLILSVVLAVFVVKTYYPQADEEE